MSRRALKGSLGATGCDEKSQDILNETRSNNEQFIQTSISDVALWRHRSKRGRLQRSDVIDGLIKKQRADYLSVVVQHGWDVNEMLEVYVSENGRVQRMERTALHHAVHHRWHEGVRLLLGAGADCNTKCTWSGVSGSNTEPQDKHTPMCVAIQEANLEMVKFLLKTGTDLKYSCCDYILVNLDRLKRISKRRRYKGELEPKRNADVLDELLTNGQCVRRNLQYLLKEYLLLVQFLPDQLDVLFRNGVHIDRYFKGSTMYYAMKQKQILVNTTRWLIRHGASCAIPLCHILTLVHSTCGDVSVDEDVAAIQQYKLPVLEFFLQVGIKHSDTLKVHLAEMERVISRVHEGVPPDEEEALIKKIHDIYSTIVSEEELNHSEKNQGKGKPFLTDREQQMAHLRKFSDQSLDVYPEEQDWRKRTQIECWEHTLKKISNMLHFLDQPHTLQWYCRVSLHERLLSLSPSVIRTLPVPAALKRYILYHEL